MYEDWAYTYYYYWWHIFYLLYYHGVLTLKNIFIEVNIEQIIYWSWSIGILIIIYLYKFIYIASSDVSLRHYKDYECEM